MSELGLGTTSPPPSTRHDERSAIRRRRHRGIFAALFALLIVAGLLGSAAYFGKAWLSSLSTSAEDYPGPGSGTVEVEIHPGDSLTTIGETLANADVVASVAAFVNAAQAEPASSGIQPGTYNLREEMSAAGAITLLLDPTSKQVRTVALPEGLWLSEALQTISASTGISLDDLKAAASKPNGLTLPAYANGHVEGFVFPATYEFPPDATATSVLNTAIARFDQSAQAVGLVAGAAKLGYTPLQVVTVASIIEAEAIRPEDYAKVSRVLYNRLAAGQKLQLDSTVVYVTGKRGDAFTTDAERATKSPYNTYLINGLPPGPIGSPGEDALKAALNPAPGPWLYFVAVNLDTGELRFATTYAEHQANIALLQQYCQTSDAC